MCPCNFQRPLTAPFAVEELLELTQVYFCQKFTAYINIHNTFVFCERCFNWTTNTEGQHT